MCVCVCMCVCQSLSGCCDESICSKYALESCQKRHGMSKETYLHVKRDLFVCQKRPICMSKETYLHVKRDLFLCQKRPFCARGDRWDLFVCQKRPICMSKETCFVFQKRPIRMSKAPRHKFSRALSITNSLKSSLYCLHIVHVLGH